MIFALRLSNMYLVANLIFVAASYQFSSLLRQDPLKLFHFHFVRLRYVQEGYV